jgi:hypothetical protein
MAKTISHLKWLLIVPIWGMVINYVYYFFKSIKNEKISRKKLFAYMALSSLMFLIGVVVFSLVCKFIKIFININFSDIILLPAFIIGGWMANIACFWYIKKVILPIIKEDESK